MGQQTAGTGGQETAGFRLHGWGGTWLRESERVAWRQQLAALVVVDELAGHSSFWRHVGELWPIHEEHHELRDDRAYRLAGRYARGRRRMMVARLLTVAAASPNGDAAKAALLGAGVRAWFVVEDEPSARPRRYGTTRGFEVRLRDGARALARRGAGSCLACGLTVGAGVAWCQTHGGSAGTANLDRSKIERDLRWTVDYAAPAVLREPVTR